MPSAFDYQLIEMIESVKGFNKLGPLVLSGPPGGYIGQLPQERVRYDTVELASSGMTGSGSLVDNLNHIRYRLQTLESGGSPGSISVYENDLLIASGVTVLNFEGSVDVLDEGGGYVTVNITGSGGSGTPGGVDTQIQFNDNSAFGGADLFWDKANNVIFQGQVFVGGGSNAWIQTEEAGSPGHLLIAYGDQYTGYVTGWAVGGTAISPSGILDNRAILRQRGRGHDGSGYTATRVEHRFVVVGDWSPSNHGTKQEFWITPSGSTAMQLWMTLDDAGADLASGTYSLDGTPINYSHISANDPSTDVTGSELEELTNGSETSLHSHAGSGGAQGWNSVTETWTRRSQAYTNDPAAGSSITLNMTNTAGFLVGARVSVSSSAGTETAVITAVVDNTSITVNTLALNHTTTNPLVTNLHGFTLSGDYSSDENYQPGNKVRYQDGGADEYGIIIANTVVSTTTYISMAANTDYELGSTITDTYTSNIENPIGYPHFFNYVPGSATGTGSMTITITTTEEARFRIVGGAVIVTALLTITVGGTASFGARFQAPTPMTEASNPPAVCQVRDSGSGVSIAGAGSVIGSLGLLQATKPDGSNWTTGTSRLIRWAGEYKL